MGGAIKYGIYIEMVTRVEEGNGRAKERSRRNIPCSFPSKIINKYKGTSFEQSKLDANGDVEVGKVIVKRVYKDVQDVDVSIIFSTLPSDTRLPFDM